jgi:hypothetical protein
MADLETHLPTRVLDLGTSLEFKELRLHVTEKGQKGKYIVLSHCWGKKPFLTTTLNTLQDFLIKIHFGDLPQTF